MNNVLKLGTQTIGTVYTPSNLNSIYDAGWSRPADWMPMNDNSYMTGSVGGFEGLYAVFTGSANFVALSATNNYYVDWGDGSPITGSAANATQQRQFNYDSMSAATYSSGSDGHGNAGSVGYRQTMIKVYPSGSGVNFTGINLQKKHTQAGLPSIPITNWLDIAVGGTNVTTMNNIGGSTTILTLLERVNQLSISSSVTSAVDMFSNCYALQSITWPALPNVTNFQNTFGQCYSLRVCPPINAPNINYMYLMFQNCPALEYIPYFDTSKVTLFQQCFYGCGALKNIPAFNTSKSTGFANMFTNCLSLQSIPSFNTTSGSTNGFQSMFSGCRSLKTIPLLDTSKATGHAFMFQFCQSMEYIPPLNTSSSTTMANMFQQCNTLKTIPPLDTRNVTSVATMFDSCYDLQTVPLFDTSKVTDFSTMFQSCIGLQSIPKFNTQSGSNFTNMFNSCYSLKYVPDLNTTNTAATASGRFTTTFASCRSLENAPLSGSRSTLSYSGCSLSREAIVDIFNNLGVTGSVACSITTSLNWGSSSLTAGDIAIATGKGWKILP